MIKKLDWEYQFLDPDTKAMLGHRRVVSTTKLAAGKTKVIENYSTRQPAVLVSADKLDRKYKDQLTENVIIHRITYTDGSIWQRPKTP